MDPLLALVAAVIAIGSTTGTRIVDRWFDRKNPYRRELVETIEQTSKARADRIEQLESDLATERAKTSRQGIEIGELKQRVERLERALDTCLQRLTAQHYDIDIPEGGG